MDFGNQVTNSREANAQPPGTEPFSIHEAGAQTTRKHNGHRYLKVDSPLVDIKPGLLAQAKEPVKGVTSSDALYPIFLKSRAEQRHVFDSKLDSSQFRRKLQNQVYVPGTGDAYFSGEVHGQ